MVCIYNPSTEQINALDRYSRILGSEEAAYYVLSQNNGFPLDKTPSDEDSDLYIDLVNHYGNEEEAIRTKAMLYTQRFFDANGDWTMGSMTDPSMYDAKGEPKSSFVLGSMTGEMESLMNHQFLLDTVHPTIEQSDLSRISPTDDLSDYAVEQLIRESYDQYTERHRNEYKRNHPSATDTELAEQEVVASRQWYSRKVQSILTEQVRSLAEAFGLVYIQKPNGTVELQTKGRNAVTGVKELRLKFLNNIINDRFEDELRQSILGNVVLSKEFTLKVPGAKDYINEAVIQRRKSDKLIAASTLINVSLTGGTSTTVNKALAYHYITMFVDSPLIQAGLEAVRDTDDRSELYLVNKLVDIITTPAIVGVENSSYVGKAFENGVSYETFKSFWDEFDDLIHQVITNGVKSEEAKKKILSVVAAAFITNDQYNLWNRSFGYMTTGPIDYYAQWYSTKYKPWGEQNEAQLSEIEAFFNLLETYYQNKIKRQERDANVSAEQTTRTSLALQFLQQSDKMDPTSQEEVFNSLFELAYQEIRDATEAIQNLHDITGINDRFSKLGSMYSDTISFYNYILNNQLTKHFDPSSTKFPRQIGMYNMLSNMLKTLDGMYKEKLYDVSCEFVDKYIDKHMDINQVTAEMVRNAKENAHRELRNNAIYGDLKNYELWITMNSLSKSSVVRMMHDSLRRLNYNRDQETLYVAQQLQKALKKAQKSLLKGGIKWAGYRFVPKNFQMLFMERYDDGTPSGMFTRKRHYGNFFKRRAELVVQLVRDIEKDIQNKTGNIYFKMELDDYGNPIFPDGEEWDEYWRKYSHAVNDFECKNGHKRFLQEYYDLRIDTLSRKAIALEDNIQNSIDIIESSVTEDGVYRPDRLTREERAQLQDLYRQQDNLGNEYTLLGEKKNGEDLKIAQEIKEFRRLIKDRVVYETDEDKYEAAKAKVDPSELSEFEKWSTSLEINPKFWEIYKILQKEYRDQFPAYLNPNFEQIERLGKERNDIVDIVKHRRGFAMPNLRDLSESSWRRVKEIDEEMDIAYEPIVAYMKSMPKGSLIPSAFKRIARLDDVMDNKEPDTTAFDALMDEARQLDDEESLALGVRVNTHEMEALDKYTRTVATAGGIKAVPLSIFSYMKPSVFPDDVKARFGIGDDFKYTLMLPNRKYNKMVEPSSSRYAEPSLVDPEFDPNEDSYVQPTELNPIYEVLEKEAPKEVFELYKLCMQVKQEADTYIPISTKLKYFLPQMRASDMAVISRMLSRGLLSTTQEVFTNKFIANETDEEIIDDFTTLPDGTRVNSVPLKFVDKLRDPSLLSSDVVGSLVLYQHMASNYYYKQQVEQLYQALLQQLGQDSDIVTDDGSRHLVLGKTTNQYAKYKNIMDNLLYDQKQLWGERGSQKITGVQKTLIKTAKFIAKLGTITALGRNILSQTTGFFDAAGKLHSFAFAGDAFNVKNITRAIAIFDKYLISGRLFLATGQILPNNIIAAIMQKNNLSTGIQYKYQGGYKNRFRRFVGMERSGMGGFRVSDYAINAVTALSIYDNYRLLDDQFLPERSFKNKLYKLGYSSKEIDRMYDDALPLLDAYDYKDSVFFFGDPEFELKQEYKDMLGEAGVTKLEQDIAIAVQTWTPKFNGAVADEDKAVIQQNILAGFTVALRSYLINELQTRFVNGADFQDPNISEHKLEILQARRKALVKVYKQSLTDNKKKTKLQKLFDRRSEIEAELISLKSSGDINSINWGNIKDLIGLSSIEVGLGYVIGSIAGPVGAYVGAGLGLAQAAANFYTNRKQSSGSNVGIFMSKVRKLEVELKSINAQIRAYEASDSRDLILMEIQQINEQIVNIKNKINENQGYYDYARNMYTNGSNRLAGRLIMNLARKAQFYINTMLPERFKSLSPKYNPKITPNQIKGLKRIVYDLVRLMQWWLITTFCLSWYRYDDGRAFLGGKFNEQTTSVMHKMDSGIKSAIDPVMTSDTWIKFWEGVHDSSTDGVISHIPFFDKVAENKSDAMLGYTKKVSRTTKAVTRKKMDAVQKQLDFIKIAAAAQSLKNFTEGIAPYDYQTINDLTNSVSATINVMTKSVEAGQNMIVESQQGKLEDPMQGGPYTGYFTRSEYGAAHSWYRPFGYPASYEQSTEIGLVNRVNYLGNTGLNRFVIPKKESVQKKGNKKKSGRKSNRGGRKLR